LHPIYKLKKLLKKVLLSLKTPVKKYFFWSIGISLLAPREPYQKNKFIISWNYAGIIIK
jgi:hypothetical protein